MCYRADMLFPTNPPAPKHVLSSIQYLLSGGTDLQLHVPHAFLVQPLLRPSSHQVMEERLPCSVDLAHDAAGSDLWTPPRAIAL
jgi:hypothetical protein